MIQELGHLPGFQAGVRILPPKQAGDGELERVGPPSMQWLLCAVPVDQRDANVGECAHFPDSSSLGGCSLL